MIATIITPILWLGALERLSRWRANRNIAARGALLTAVALALMGTLDVPLVTGALEVSGLRPAWVLTLQRLLLLAGCHGALVFALALDGRVSAKRIYRRVLPLLFVALLVVVNQGIGVLAERGGATNSRPVALAVETTLVFTCLAVTSLVVAYSTWRASKRSRVHRTQLRVLSTGGVVLALVAVVNVVAGGFLLHWLQIGVWGLRINRLMLDASFAGWALVLMANWAATTVLATREWIRLRPAFDQVGELFPDLVPVVPPGGGWVETVDARATVVLDGWAMLARPGEQQESPRSTAERATAVARWLDQDAAYGSVTAPDLAP